MIVKAEVTQKEKDMICGFAKRDGKTISAYLKSRALQEKTSDSSECMLRCIDIQSGIARDINSIATTILKNKAIYEAEILELLDRMTALEQATATALKEVRRDGHTRK